MIVSSTSISSSIDFSVDFSSLVVEENNLLIQEIEEKIEFLVSPWVKDCSPLPSSKKVSFHPVLAEKKSFTKCSSSSCSYSCTACRKSSAFSSNFSSLEETVEENISSWLEVSSTVLISTVQQRNLYHREDVFSLVIDENTINDLYWDSFYEEQDAVNYLHDSFPFIVSFGNVKEIDSDNFRHYLSYEYIETWKYYFPTLSYSERNNFRHYLSYEYISEETWKYYFPTLSYSERNNIRSGFILARLAGIVPATFVSLGFSKKAACKVYSQFSWDYTSEHASENLLEKWQAWNDRLPEELSKITLLDDAVQKRIITLWKKDPDSFYHEEKVMEMGHEIILPRNINRIYSLLQYIPSDLSEFRFNGNSVSSFLRSLEEFALPEDSSVFPDMKNWPEEFTIPTRCPKKIYRLGLKYKNCLRQKALTWNTNNWVAECDGVVFEFCNETYSYFLIDAKLPCNEEPSEEFVDFLKRKLHNI